MSYWTIARCPDGHLFETPNFPLVSFKSIRLRPGRLQRCPVGKHWVKVHFVPARELSSAELEDAHSHRTSPVP